jgi:hypothetical protein
MGVDFLLNPLSRAPVRRTSGRWLITGGQRVERPVNLLIDPPTVSGA